MSPETVEKIARINCKHNSIIISGNPYGYKVDVNHPKIRPLYDRFKERIGRPIAYPLSDRERFQFENFIIQRFERNKKR